MCYAAQREGDEGGRKGDKLQAVHRYGEVGESGR